ncbi:unnamed protein product [Caenorhabditis angaria]|uniref:Uncharacterized protein n=1 Tax=Caenorhabditis angaria TaxID=860376 RepID=A0A9P1I972_9PELO|nr:unnamed protein product [Caenorhabditis angaria]
MSTNLVPPQVIVDTPRPKDQNGEFENGAAGLISVSLSNFVNSTAKSPGSKSSGGAGKKSPTTRSPRISPRASPRLMKKKV